MRTLCRSGDHWQGREGVGAGGNVVMDRGVSGGRKNSWIGENKEFSFSSKILLPVDAGEKGKGGVEEGLEDVSGNRSLEELPELSQHKELQDLELHGSKVIQPSLNGDRGEGGGCSEVDPSTCIVMVELEIVVDKWGPLELQVLLNCIEHNRVFEDRGIEIMGAVKGKVVEADRNDGGDGSHVQEGLKWRPKVEGLICISWE